MRKSFLTLLIPALVGSFLLVGFAYAQGVGSEIGRQLGATAGGAALGPPTDPRLIIASIIRVALSLIGTVMLVLNLYGGYLWMTAGGNDEQITKAKTTIRNATIGLVIVLSAYSITIAVANLAQGYPLGPSTFFQIQFGG
ncbi:MAG: hypothetical protein A2754_02385 [Candidatus Magasanikbacteria bacterium RIFCSPHIGHO2_01_FULL_47_8]|uniref:Uncharacterized protein n=1 Tax=Candidatus Magasanikbacteria bacterium RIFCSPHIGHO2_01_FULL_47_8 TaxID=1798673 RepID=A0A1F6MCL3_9BACT|nr:MAG: hypothetical protein A2754_02385 [Candidatus Magasanikbacteria bacterium RIFCSPHIGHO2_01_FULL_47_8]